MQSIYLLKDNILNACNSEQHLYIALFSNLNVIHYTSIIVEQK